MTYPVKWFSHDMGGAPGLGDTAAGDFSALLKACLINGFNTQAVTELAYDAATGKARATVPPGHGFLPWQVVLVEGATETGYSGEHRVTEVGSDWIEYAPAEAPSASPATGTITVKAAPVGGWQIAHEDAASNQLLLERTSPEATPYKIHILNDGWAGSSGENANYARVRAVANVTDLETWDAVIDYYWPASMRLSNQKTWLLIADGLALYWIPQYTSRERISANVLGDINTLRPADAGHFVLTGIQTGSDAKWDKTDDSCFDLPRHGTTAYRRIATGHHQMPGSVAWESAGLGSVIGSLIAHPNPATNGLHVATTPPLVIEGGNILRGYLPGLLQPLQTHSGYHRAILDHLPGLEGVPVMFYQVWDDRNVGAGSNRLLAWRLDDWRG